MKAIFISIIVGALLPLGAVAQQVNVKFARMNYSLGSISEDSDPQTVVFKFINQGEAAVAITNVQTSCGCAVANYPRTPIAPGASSEIQIAYNPQGHPGKFNRSILVRFSGSSEFTTLYISGEVIAGKERKHKGYPYVMGNLQLKIVTLRFGPMRSNEQELGIPVINSGNVPLEVKIQSTIPNCTASVTPLILAPDEAGEIMIIRKTNSNKTQRLCVRLQADKAQKEKLDKLIIQLIEEKCQ